LHSLLLGLAVTGVALAAEPAAGDKPAEPGSAAAPSAEKKPEVDLDPAKAPEKKKTASELEASTGDEHSDKNDKGGSEVADEDFGHGFQFGIRAGIVAGYRMVFRYDKSPFCRAPEMGKADKDQQKFCGHGAPPAIDVALSFAPLDFVEPYVWARFGLGGESETNTESVLAFGAGARIYTMSDSKFKIYVEPAVGFEVESGAGNPDWNFKNTVPAEPEYKKDFLFHLAVGGQYDFARAFGIYLSAGLTTGVLRYIHTGLEVGGGAQLRFP
jgi:hypothetical protein